MNFEKRNFSRRDKIYERVETARMTRTSGEMVVMMGSTKWWKCGTDSDDRWIFGNLMDLSSCKVLT